MNHRDVLIAGEQENRTEIISTKTTVMETGGKFLRRALALLFSIILYLLFTNLSAAFQCRVQTIYHGSDNR